MTDKKVFKNALVNVMKALEHKLKTINNKINALESEMNKQDIETAGKERKSDIEKLEKMVRLQEKEEVFYSAIIELRTLYCNDGTSPESLVFKTIILAVLDGNNKN